MASTLGACGDESPPHAVEPTPTLDAGTVCPAKLPRGDGPEGHGYGAQEDARDKPSLPTPERAWACRYDAVDSGQTANGDTRWAWVLHGSAQEVVEPELGAFADALGQVIPFEGGDRVCTADLGPRWLVVYPHGARLVGVAVDDYGCREVRLTDDPSSTPPGDAERDGTVPGVLDGGTEVLTALGLGRH